MTIVYIQIFIATRRRLRERANASKINAISRNQSHKQVDLDRDSVSSGETNHNDKSSEISCKKGKKKKSNSKEMDEAKQLKPILVNEDWPTDMGKKYGFLELLGKGKTSSTKKQKTRRSKIT